MRHISILRGHERECVALTSEWWPDVLQPRRIGGEALGVSNFEIGSSLLAVILFDAARQLRAHFQAKTAYPGGWGNVAEIYPLVTILLIAAAMAVVRMIV